MNTTVTRRPTTVRLPDYMLADLHTEAQRQGISVSRLLENITEERMYHPNADTLAAIEEARSGVEMEELTPYQIEHFEEYVASL
jgi:predicted DNA-binding ribbon-helix-helix protein